MQIQEYILVCLPLFSSFYAHMAAANAAFLVLSASSEITYFLGTRKELLKVRVSRVIKYIIYGENMNLRVPSTNVQKLYGDIPIDLFFISMTQ